MIPPLRSADENSRLSALRRYGLLDTEPEQGFDDLTALAAQICETPISLISLVDDRRQWFKSRLGLSITETDRDISFCTHTIQQPDVFLVEDATQDERFARNPLVTGEPGIRFYAGAPLTAPGGETLGTLCVLDRVPRQLRPDQQQALQVLSRQVMAQLELRLQMRELTESEFRLFEVFRNCPVAVTISGMKDRKFVDVNAAFSNLTGWTREEVAGRSTTDLGIVEPAAAAQIRLRLKSEGRIQNLEVEIKTRTGEIRHVLVGIALLDLRSGLHAVSTFVDITERKRAEEALSERNIQLLAAMELGRMGLWSFDLRSDALATRGWGALAGISETEYPRTGTAARALVHPDDLPMLSQKLSRAAEGDSFEAEFRIVLPDESQRWVEARGQAVREPNGTVVCLMGVERDTTEQRRAERRILHLNRVYAVLSGINEIIVREADPQTMLTASCGIAVDKGRFRLAWVALAHGRELIVAAHAGATRETLKIVEKLLSVDERDRACAFTMQAMETGQHSICNDILRDPRTETWRAAALEREYRSMASLPLRKGAATIGTLNLYSDEQDFFDAEELRLLEELAMDLSFALVVHERECERRRVEEELRASEERFRQLAENVHEVFWITDVATNQVLYVNPAYERIWKHSCTSLYQSPLSWLDSVFPEDRPRILARIEGKPAKDFDETFRIQWPDGTIRWIHNRGFPVRSPAGEVLRHVGTAADITLAKQAQDEQVKLEFKLAQAAKMEAVGRLAGGVAHDFNNMLTVILGYAEAARDARVQDGTYRQHLAEIEKAANRSKQITQQLLGFSRQQIFAPVPSDLNDLVPDLLHSFGRLIGEDIELTFRPARDLWKVEVDRSQVNQILLNLVVNARDAMPSGGKLTVETANANISEEYCATQPEAAPGQYTVLTVSDTGEGMDAETKAHIFEPFFTTKSRNRGTGLGLATVFGIVKQNNGFLTVYSELNYGTTFKIYFPRMAGEGGEAEQLADARESRAGSGTILLVEDDELVRGLTKFALERFGYTPLVAKNPAEAIELCVQRGPEIKLVLSDVVMPGMNGMELQERLLALRADLKMLFMSGYTSEMVVNQGVLKKGLNFIQKPFSIDELGRRLEELLADD